MSLTLSYEERILNALMRLPKPRRGEIDSAAVDAIRAILKPLHEDAGLLDWLDQQWMDPLHIEVNAKGNADVRVRRDVTLWQGAREYARPDVRATITAAKEGA